MESTGKVVSDLCPVYAPFFGAMGAVSALVFCVLGSAYGTAKAGVGIASVGVMKPDFIMKALVPVIFAAAIGIYGLIIAILINDGVKQPVYPLANAFSDLAAGLCCGLSGLAAGMAIGVVGDAGVRSAAQQPQMYIGVVLILIFAEALALFGMILGIVLQGRTASESACVPLTPMMKM
jgi:V-type H+-transporting ATPase 16kDa proteolipid subunit